MGWNAKEWAIQYKITRLQLTVRAKGGSLTEKNLLPSGEQILFL